MSFAILSTFPYLHMYYIQAGGPFMWPLIIIALVILGFSIKKTIDLFQHTNRSAEDLEKGLSIILQLGLFGFIWGVLAQALGLYQMLSAIEGIEGEVAPALLAGGLKVSMIAPLFGLIILVVSSAVWFVLRLRVRSTVAKTTA